MKINDKKELKQEEIKKIALDVLIDVADFCDKNNIVYYLSCGTLLGAIRHHGFIPWDDDIDIMMFRTDYNIFLSKYKSEKYKLLKPSAGMYYYAKVYDSNTIKIEPNIDYKKYDYLGIDVDIFPIDGIVNDDKVINKMRTKTKILETLLRLSNQPIFYRKNPLKCVNRIIPRMIGSKRLVKMIENNCQKFNINDCDYVIRMRNSPNGFTGAQKKDVYYPPAKREFQGYMFNVPNDYDRWLSNFFGDYLTLPPEEKRKSHHNTKCYQK